MKKLWLGLAAVVVLILVFGGQSGLFKGSLMADTVAAADAVTGINVNPASFVAGSGTSTISFTVAGNPWVSLEVRNSANTIVRVLLNARPGAGSKNYVWDGKDNSGIAVVAGAYKFVIRLNNAATGEERAVTVTAPSPPTIAVVRNATVADNSVPPGAAQAKIASFVLAAGASEGVNVRTIVLKKISGNNSDIYNITLKIPPSGSTAIRQLGDTAAHLNTDGSVDFSLRDSLPLAASGSAAIDVYADVAPTCTSAPSSKIQLAVAINGISGAGVTSHTAISTPTSQLALQTVSCMPGGLSVSSNSAFSPAPITAGARDKQVASLKIQTTIAEDVRISSIKLDVTNDFTFATVRLKTHASPPVQIGFNSVRGIDGKIDFSGITGLTVPRNSFAIIDVYADVAATGCSGRNSFSISSNGVTGYGVVSGQAISAPVSVINLQSVPCSSDPSVPPTPTPGGGGALGPDGPAFAVSKNVLMSDGFLSTAMIQEKIASFKIQIASGEAVNFTSVALALKGTFLYTSITNLRLKEETVPGSLVPVGNIQAVLAPDKKVNFSITPGLNLPANSTHIFNLYADIADSIGSNCACTIISSIQPLGVRGTRAILGTLEQEPAIVVNLQTMTAPFHR